MTTPKRRVMRLRRRVEEILLAPRQPSDPPKKGEAAGPPPEGGRLGSRGVEKVPRGQEAAYSGPAPVVPPWARGNGGDLQLPRGTAPAFSGGQGPLELPQQDLLGALEPMPLAGWNRGQDPLEQTRLEPRDNERLIEELRRQRRRSPQIQDFWEELT